MKQNHRNLGFTLIELLVVISVISMVSSILLVAVKNTRIKARDARRIADVNQLSKALQLFYDKYGIYPHCSMSGYPGGCDLVNFGNPGSIADSSLDGNFMGFLSEFIKVPPKDPLNTINPPFLYGYSMGQYPLPYGEYYHYFIVARLEDPNHPALKSSVYLGPQFSGWYVVAEQK